MRWIAALVVVAVVVAACGSSGSSNKTSSAPAAGSSPASSGSTSSSAGVAIKTAKNAQGTFLIGPSGRTLYLWVADKGDKSVCNGACASVWPPLTTKGTPSAAGGVVAADLGTTTRSDGTKQVTYKGHPLYYYVSDSGPGMVTGQGSDSFGAKWWLVAPSGSAITASASTSAGSGGSSSSGSSGY